MFDRTTDPRTDDTLVYELLRTPRGASQPMDIGRATFRGGASVIDAPDDEKVAVEELHTRAF